MLPFDRLLFTFSKNIFPKLASVFSSLLCSSLVAAIGVDAQVGVLPKGVEESVDVFGLTAAVGADNTAGDEIIDVGDTAVVRDVAVVPYDVAVDVDSAVKVVI